MKTDYVASKGSLEVKRLYLPIVVKVICPLCNTNLERDFEEDYLSYPLVGVDEKHEIYCEDCEEEISFDVKLTLHMEACTMGRINKD
jgi:uncharacterized protein YbaR (Trm112 family)